MPDFDGGVGLAEPVETEVAETEPIGSGEPESGTEPVAEVDSLPENPDLTQKTAPKGKIDLAKLAQSSKEQLKAINPILPSAIEKAARELGSFYGEFPGGLREARELKTTVSEYGGVEGLKESQEALADYGSLEQLFEKGDAAFMQRLAEAAPASFAQIMPAGMEHWKKADPEGYNHAQARVLVQTLDGIRASDTLAAIWEKLPEGAEKTSIASLWQSLDGFRKLAEKAPEKKIDPQNEALTRREQELAQRETKALLAPIATEGKQQIQSIVDRQMTESYQWDKTDPSVKEAVSERVRTEVVKASRNDKAFLREFDRLKDRGDAAGLTKHVKAFQDRVTAGIVQRVAKLFAVKPKAAGLPAKKAAMTTGNTTPVATGWTRVSAQPSFKDIDRAAMGRNYEDMIMDRKAILKDKRRVTWG